MLTIIDGATEGGTTGPEVMAVVADLGPERSTVLLGTAQETWDFPREMLPARVEVGSHLFVEMAEGRPVRTRLNPDREATRRKGIDHRLERLERYERLTGHEVRVA